MTPQRWAKAVPAPTANNRAVEALFLDDHWHYGGRVHEQTAAALVAALAEPSEMHVGHNLYLRLFTEYATALETLGAWGWTLRHYREYQLFLDAFLAYPATAPREFFTAARRNRSGSLSRLVQLPRIKRLPQALADGFEISVPQFEQMALLCVVELKKSSSQYFSSDEIIRTTYNKAKHGATIFRTPSLGSRQFQVLAPHLLVRGHKDKARYDISTFTINKQMIRALANGVLGVSAQIRFLAGIARALLAADLLYG